MVFLLDGNINFTIFEAIHWIAVESNTSLCKHTVTIIQRYNNRKSIILASRRSQNQLFSSNKN